jgi:Transposase DDE domain/Transposase domain (DUF772)
MYGKNEGHRQKPLFSSLNDLPAKEQQRLADSWAGTFYEECFSRIDEDAFAVLYSEEASRPNIAVNVLVSLEIMKAGFGWSDAELESGLHFDLQVRYALGYRNLDEGHFELRTVYNFRRRLTEHMQQTGENLLEQAFEQITDEQLSALEICTEKLRMDSFQIASNIREMSRLQLLVEVIQRMAGCLSEFEQARYEALLSPYLKGSSGQYVYHLKAGEGQSHLQAIGQVMRQLVKELALAYAEETAYAVLKRVYEEHFVEVESGIRPKMGSELSASSLQSPDDWEASYRQKGGKGYKGYVTNLTETCHPENDLQRIVKVQTEANNSDDAQMLLDALPNLKARTEVEEMYTDGGYNSEAVDEALIEQEVELIQTAIRGRSPNEDSLNLTDFEWEVDGQAIPQQVTCPNGQTVPVQPARQKDRYTARFDHTCCQDCPLLEQCPTQSLKRHPQRVLRFTKRQVTTARRRQRRNDPHQNLRRAVEASVRSVKHPFGNGKLPVRGRIRMRMMMVASAAMTNVRRIWRSETMKQEAKAMAMTLQNTQKQAPFAVLSSPAGLLFRFFALFTRQATFQPVAA